MTSSNLPPTTGLPDLPLATSLPIVVQSTLWLLTAAACTVHFLSPLHTRFLPYGKARTTPPSQSPPPSKNPPTTSSPTQNTIPRASRGSSSPLLYPLDLLSRLTVPKSYFTHYYTLLLTLTLWIGLQLFTRSPLLKLFLEAPTPGILRWGGYLDNAVQKYRGGGKMEGPGNEGLNGIGLAVGCVALQALRRLVECLTLDEEGRKVFLARQAARRERGEQPGEGEVVLRRAGGEPGSKSRGSESKMHLGIYVFGMFFYVLLSLAVWVDSSHTVLSTPRTSFSWDFTSGPPMPVPSMRTFVALPAFLLLSGIQYDIHLYLASLEKYTLPPPQGYFALVLCPHYLVEIGIYFSLLMMRGMNSGSMIAALAFVVTNLTFQGSESKKWYEKTFGKDKVRGRGGVWPWY